MELADIAREGKATVKYAIAWLLGIPASILLVWYILAHVR